MSLHREKTTLSHTLVQVSQKRRSIKGLIPKETNRDEAVGDSGRYSPTIITERRKRWE